MKSGVTVLLDRTQEIAKSLAALADQSVLVGIPSDKNSRDADGTPGPITNAELGYLHENGMPEMNIPARPTLLPGVKGSKGEWLHYLRDAASEALAGNSSGVDKNLSAAGLTAVNAVRAYITDSSNYVALSAVTIANRLRKGRTGTKPLIDTGQFRKAFTYVVRKGR